MKTLTMDTVIHLIVFLTTAVAVINSQAVIVGPTDVTAKLGTEVSFTCEVDMGTYGLMQWQLTEPPKDIYLYLNGEGHIVPPDGADKYTVEHNGNTFTLTIKALTWEDGGRYSCSVTGASALANLVVLEQPLLTLPTSPIEDTSVLITCEGRFGAPRKDQLVSEQTPEMAIFLDGHILDTAIDNIIDQIPGTVLGVYDKRANVTLTYYMHGSPVTCEMKTQKPDVVVTDSKTMEVRFSVRDIELNPTNDQYYVGYGINCTAQGSPEPTYKWTALKSSGSATVSQSRLELTSNMLGENEWECEARNQLGTGPIQTDSITIQFTVVEAPATDPPTGEVKGDSWKVAVGVAVPICLIVVGSIIGLVVYTFVVKKGRNRDRSGPAITGSHDSNVDNKGSDKFDNTGYNKDDSELYENDDYISEKTPPITIYDPHQYQYDLSLTGNGIGPDMGYPLDASHYIPRDSDAVYTKPTAKKRNGNHNNKAHSDAVPRDMHVSFDDQKQQDELDSTHRPMSLAQGDNYSDYNDYRTAPLPPNHNTEV